MLLEPGASQAQQAPGHQPHMAGRVRPVPLGQQRRMFRSEHERQPVGKSVRPLFIQRSMPQPAQPLKDKPSAIKPIGEQRPVKVHWFTHVRKAELARCGSEHRMLVIGQQGFCTESAQESLHKGTPGLVVLQVDK
ncbi:MAG: hypothetical protein E6Q49_04550 [Limnohabitans sp.]|nr:MAG: hypothetical protein E6Q49_04550 [Limnohabitans sp.]